MYKIVHLVYYINVLFYIAYLAGFVAEIMPSYAKHGRNLEIFINIKHGTLSAGV